MKVLALAVLLAAATAASATIVLPAVTPQAEGTYLTGISTVPAAACPPGYAASTKPADLALGSALLESWLMKVAMPDLVAKNVRGYACPGGTKCDYTRSVSVCMPTETIAGQTAFMFAQGIVEYRCNWEYLKHYTQYKKVAIYLAKGAYTADKTTTEGPFVGASKVPAVTALPASNTLQKGSYKVNAGQTIALITCPKNYQRRSNWGTVDQEDTMARKLVDDYFVKIALPALRKAGNTQYGCPFGAKFVDGDPFFAAVKDTTTKHTRTSSCFQTKPPAKGKTATMYAQGIINYYCLDKNGRKSGPYKYVAVYTAAGSFTQPK